jgi:hypothetical protein
MDVLAWLHRSHATKRLGASITPSLND